LLREMFNEQDSRTTELTIVQSMGEAEKYLAEDTCDIVLLDLGLPDAQGLAAVRRAHETSLDPRSLELELTESVLMKHAASTATILQTLRESGIQVAVDDFGTGYSSLSYLRKFPVDAVKIDQSFVRQISTAGDDTTIVKAVIGMARGLKLRVIAEGVETQEELAFLRAYQCDDAQGYYFSRPVLPQQFAMLLNHGISEFAVFVERSPAVAARGGTR
jgi:EAL domain-containing protein (putative c-di-GMP-specific phosphodiesterase class I)